MDLKIPVDEEFEAAVLLHYIVQLGIMLDVRGPNVLRALYRALDVHIQIAIENGDNHVAKYYATISTLLRSAR